MAEFDFEDDDLHYLNRIKTVDDILDSPLLTTDRFYAHRAVQRAAKVSAPIRKAYTVNGMVREASLRLEITYQMKQLADTELDHFDKSAIDLVQAVFLKDSEVVQLPLQLRFPYLHEICKADDLLKERLKTNLGRSELTYDKMRLGVKTQLSSTVSPLASRIPFRTEYFDLYANYAAGDALLERLIHKRQEKGLQNKSGVAYVDVKGSNLKRIIVAGEIVAFCEERTCYITSWDDLLCLRSMAIFRRNCYLLCSIDKNLPRKLGHTLTKMLNWQEEVVKVYDNPGYELVKATESVFKARLMQLSDGPCDGDAFSLMISKQKEKEQKLSSGKGTPLVTKLEALALSVTNVRIATELFGSLKFSGHPYIDPKLASASSREHGTSESKASAIETMKMRAEFCDMILRGYIKKHGRWPALRFGQNSNTQLESLYHKKSLSFAPTSYPFTDWYYVSFPQFMEFDYNIDYLDLMDDKSAGLDPQDAWKAWNQLKSENYQESIVPDSRSKKLIIRILSMPEFDPFKICEQIRHMDLSKAELSMALYPKEKEFKLEARLFVMLEFSVRVFLTLAEKNFKRLMKDYLPEQSMTKGRKGTMQYLEKLSQGIRKDEYDTCFIEVDLSRWNLLWRGEVVNPVSRVIDDIFNLPNAFSKGHDIFSASTIVVRVPSELPDGVTAFSSPSQWPESDYVWRNHVGGFEGIIQGQWTACTQAAIKMIMRDLSVISYQLLGQGDNQVLSIVFKRNHNKTPQQDALDQAATITAELERRFARLNQIVKPEECLVSRTVVTYSKLCFVNGVQVPTTLKHAATVAPVGTSCLPCLVTGLSSISSGCRASADNFSDPSTAYLYYLILFRDYLNRGRLTLPCKGSLRGTKFTDDFLDLACLIPSDLGGLPIQVPSDFLYGGCSDRLSSSTASLVAGSHTDIRLKRYLAMLETDHAWQPSPKPENLMNDPFAVPILEAIGADVKVDNAIKEVIPTITNNKALSQIMSTNTAAYEEILKSHLASVRPLYPLLMADVVELSICGVRKKILKKFTGTRTIQQLVRKRAPINYNLAIVTADLARINRLTKLLDVSLNRKLTSNFGDFEIYSRVEHFRTRWFPGSADVIKGVTTIHPFECKIDVGLKVDSKDYIEVISPVDWHQLTSTVGPHPGRWGDKTWEHRRVSGVEVIGKQKSVLASKRLLLLESQISASGGLKDAIRDVLRQRTTYDQETLKQLMPTTAGGAGAHRWDSTIEDKAFAWLGPISTTQHVSVQSDTMSTLSGGSRDFAFCFQEHMFFGMQCLRASGKNFESNPTLRLHYIIEDRHEIANHPIQSPKWNPKIKLPRLDENPLVCTSDILFQALSEEMPSTIAPVQPLPEACSISLGSRLMVHSVLDQLENPVLSDAVLEDREAPSGMSYDVGSLIGVGLKAVVDASALAVFLRCVEMIMTETGSMDRVVFNTYLDNLAAVAALPLARFANTPKVRSQPWVRKTGILVAPGRHGGKVLQSRIAAIIKETAHYYLENLANIDRFRIILLSYAERATPSKVLGCYVALLMLLLNPKHVEAGRRLYRRHINTVRKEESEKGRLALHIEILKKFQSASDLGDASIIADELLRGRILSRTQMGIDDAKRYLRSGPSGKTDSRQVMTLPVPKFPKSQGEFMLDAYRPVMVAPRFPLDRTSDALNLIRRNESWKAGLSSISRVSLPFLSTFASQIRTGVTLCVGVGNGALARDAFALGAEKILGIDLSKDLPQLSSLGSAYLPPEIPVVEPAVDWKWLSAVFNKGGDWFCKGVHEEALSHQPNVILLDIQTGERQIWKDIEPIVSSGIKTTIITRRHLDQSELVDFKAVALGTFKTVTIACSPYDKCEYWVALQTSGGKSFGYSMRNEISLIPYIPNIPQFITPFYPDVTDRVRTDVWKGKRLPSASISVALDVLLNPFRAATFKGRRRLESEDAALTAHVALSVKRINDMEYTDMNDIIRELVNLATTDPPTRIQNMNVGTIRKPALFNVCCRLLPKLITLKNRFYLIDI